MISIVIPCYNSEKSIGELVDGLQKLPGQINEDIEIILVNDRSKDNTFAVIERLADKYSNITAIDMMFNVGQFMAIMCGFEHCNGEYIITMDDDLQHPPEEIPKLINAIREDASCTAIIASFDNKKHNIFRNFGSWLVHQIDVKVFNKPKDWLIYSPTYFNVLKFHGIKKGLLEEVMENEQVMLVGCSHLQNVLETYYKDHYNSNVTYKKLENYKFMDAGAIIPKN